MTPKEAFKEKLVEAYGKSTFTVTLSYRDRDDDSAERWSVTAERTGIKVVEQMALEHKGPGVPATAADISHHVVVNHDAQRQSGRTTNVLNQIRQYLRDQAVKGSRVNLVIGEGRPEYYQSFGDIVGSRSRLRVIQVADMDYELRGSRDPVFYDHTALIPILNKPEALHVFYTHVALGKTP